MLAHSLLILTLTAVSMRVLADTVWLKNGDRLTGRISVLDGGKLLIETNYGGSIPVRWSQVKTIEANQLLLVELQGGGDKIARKIEPGEEGDVILYNGVQQRAVPLGRIVQIIHPKPLAQDFSWEGNIDVALDYKRAGTNTDDYDVSFDTKAKHDFWRQNLNGEYEREFEDGETTTNIWEAEYALDRFIDEHWFWQGRLEYSRDEIEEISHQLTVGTGPGYQFWDNELGSLSVASLFNRTDYKFAGSPNESFYSLALKWDYNRHLVGKTFELFSTGELGKPFSNVADYALDANIGLRYRVTDWASLNMKAEKDLVSGAAGELDETSYTLGFGVGW